jgi:precorrin-6B methylase 1
MVTRCLEVVAVINRLRVQAIVIAREDDHRPSQTAQLLLSKGNRFVWNAIMIEQIPGNEQHIYFGRHRTLDDRLKALVI